MSGCRCRFAPIFLFVATAATLAGGCAKSRVVTISAIPSDSTILVDDKVRGRGPITETFTFSGDKDRYRIRARREGYREQFKTVAKDDTAESVVLDLKPIPKVLTFVVKPVAATIKLDGVPLSPTRVREIQNHEVSFKVDAFGKWDTHTITVEHENFDTIEQTLHYDDPDATYVLDLQAKRKNVQIVSNPPGADVFINDKPAGKTPLTLKSYAFSVDPETGEFIPQKLVVKKAGYQDKTVSMGWDGGKENYDDFTLAPNEKVVRIVTEPRDAIVKINGTEIKRDASGAAAAKLSYPPINEQGDSVPYTLDVYKPKTGDDEWKPEQRQIAWDNGEVNYNVKLKEILTRPVSLLRWQFERKDGAWTVLPQQLKSTIAMKSDAEASEANKLVKITHLKGANVDTVAVSPDGSQIAFTTLSPGDAGPNDLHSQILLQRTDGSAADPKPLTDGKSLEITPSFTPDGSHVVFASNRGGRKLSIWSVPAGEQPVPERLTILDNNELWPTVDSSPKPRLFYQTFIDTRPDPRLYSTQLGAMMPRDLVANGGTQPRISPTADAVVFCAANPKTHKRDIYRVSDVGRDLVNLTNTPDVDEFDPAWSSDGIRIAFVSDANRGGDTTDNYDIYVMDATGGPGVAPKPQRVTTNGSWDDSPAWGGSNAIYFRSNRGAEWNVWRIDLK
jgi:dipeptidyl aminopeptidase/acylaminoacyl peptidase